MNAAERAERDADVLRLFVSGVSYRRIAAAVGVSLTSVDRIVKKELSKSGQRRALLNDEALAIHQERQERLFEAHWGPALKGDHRSAEICRRMLAQQARLYGLDADVLPSLPAPTSTTGVGDEDEEPADELDRLRRARRTSGD